MGAGASGLGHRAKARQRCGRQMCAVVRCVQLVVLFSRIFLVSPFLFAKTRRCFSFYVLPLVSRERLWETTGCQGGTATVKTILKGDRCSVAGRHHNSTSAEGRRVD